MIFDPYKILGIETNATIEEIHASYRKLSKTLHPDAGGGNDLFIELTRAYDILSKPELRHKYDELGIADDYIEESVKNLQQLFIGLLDSISADNLPHVDIVAMMVQNIVMNRSGIVNALNALHKQKQKYEKNLSIIKKRLKAKKKNFLIYAAEEAIAKILIPIAQNEKLIAMFDQMLELLGNYEYEWEEAPITPTIVGIGSFFNNNPNIYPK